MPVGGLPAIAVDARHGHAFAINEGSSVGAGMVSVLDTRDGRLLGRTMTGHVPIAISADGSDDRAVILNDDDTASIFDAPTGRIVRTIAVGGTPLTVATAGRAGHALIAATGSADCDGVGVGVTVLKTVGTQPGVDDRTIRIGGALDNVMFGADPGPVVMAMDERTGHTIVAEQSSTVCTPDPWSWIPQGLRGYLPFMPRHAAHTDKVPGSLSVLDTRP